MHDLHAHGWNNMAIGLQKKCFIANCICRQPDGVFGPFSKRNRVDPRGYNALFRNKRFALNKIFQQNASKFAIFYFIRKPM